MLEHKMLLHNAGLGLTLVLRLGQMRQQLIYRKLKARMTGVAVR